MSDKVRRITSLELSKNNKKCKVYVDSEFWDSISLDIVMKHKLSKGVAFDDTLEKLIALEQRTIDVKQTAYNFAAYKPRTKKQVQERLQQNGFNSDEVEIAIQFLQKFNYIDDEKYAFTYAREYVNRKSCGRAKIIAELFKKGIDKDLAERAADACLEQHDCSELVRQSAQNKLKRLISKPKDKQKQLLIAHLKRQGFEWDSIKGIVEEMF